MNKHHTSNGAGSHTSNGYSITANDATNIYIPDYIDTIFQRLDAQNVEQFYNSYHLWTLQQRIKTLQAEISALEQAVSDNAALMQQVQPSAIALASLAQLQASGIDDLDLLEKMLARGDTWLDHTMQLLEQCEKLDVIRGDYKQWCEHALEGAYEWMFSIDHREQTSELTQPSATEQLDLQTPTEEQLLLKLMSEDGEVTEKIPVLRQLPEAAGPITLMPSALNKKITRPLEEIEVPDTPLPVKKVTQPLEQPASEVSNVTMPMRKITQPLTHSAQNATEVSVRKTTQPLEQEEAFPEMDLPETPSTNKITLPSSELLENTEYDQQACEPVQVSDTSIEKTEEAVITPASNEEPVVRVQLLSATDETRPASTASLTERSLKKSASEEILEAVDSPSAPDTPTINGSMKLSVRTHENTMPQQMRQRGFWFWLFRVFAALLRR